MPHFSRLPGGRYEARQNDDGTWDVLDVPMFSVIKKGTKGAPRDIVEEDLRQAVRTHQQKFREDRFLPRTNVLHNYGLHRPSPAGFFLPRDVRHFRMGGVARPTIFSDLIAVPDDVFRMIESNALPYLSPEVRTYEPLVFGALALLDTEPPFFEYPIISIGRKTNADVARIDDEGGPALAVASCGEASSFLFSFREDEPMPEDVEKDVDEAQMMEGDGDLKGAISAIEAKMKEFQPLLELLPKLEEMLGGQGDEPAEELADEPVAAMSADTDEETVKMEARVAALEDFRDKTAKEKEVDALFSKVVNALEGEGYDLSDKTKERLFAAAGKGEDILTMFADEYRDSTPKDPPRGLEGVGEEEWPAEVMAFAQRSPEQFAAAQKCFREWREIPADKHRSPLDKYLKREVG